MQKWFHKYPNDGVAVHALHHALPRQPELPPKLCYVASSYPSPSSSMILTPDQQTRRVILVTLL